MFEYRIKLPLEPQPTSRSDILISSKPFNWLKSEIDRQNFDIDSSNLSFKYEEDKVKFILKWL